MKLYPYLQGNAWVFDDDRFQLTAEPFVNGTSEIISSVVKAKRIPDAANGFELCFSAEPGPCDAELIWIGAAEGGNWYKAKIGGRWMYGWLCPALFHYFEAAPRRIYATARPLPAKALGAA